MFIAGSMVEAMPGYMACRHCSETLDKIGWLCTSYTNIPDGMLRISIACTTARSIWRSVVPCM
eukprot:11183241-Karenia_brevis.AAC.1